MLSLSLSHATHRGGGVPLSLTHLSFLTRVRFASTSTLTQMSFNLDGKCSVVEYVGLLPPSARLFVIPFVRTRPEDESLELPDSLLSPLFVSITCVDESDEVPFFLNSILNTNNAERLRKTRDLSHRLTRRALQGAGP